MDKRENQIAELFNKPDWTVQDWQTIRDLLEQQAPGSIQSFFQENYISELAKGVQPPSDKARELLKQIHSRAGIAETTSTPVVSIKRRNYWSRIAVAASILIVVGISTYFLFFNPPTEQNIVVTNEKPADVTAPQTNRAMITLADGTTVYLDSAGNGTLASQSGVNVIKTADGQIVYDDATRTLSKDELIYNTLTNPRGSKVIDMTLSDGSRVWLNAGSSVTYPVAFIGNERKVAIAGEAYFEITHNKSQPFKVTKDDLEVVVLGTHFNVNAYDDEEQIKVTLLEGSVKVLTTNQLNLPAGQAGNSTILKPGQQARIVNSITRGGAINVQMVDVDRVMAWQRGMFELSQTELPEIMRQISRWYDLDIVYEGKPGNEKFGGGISKNVPLSSMLKLLEANGVKCTLEGKTLKVRP